MSRWQNFKIPRRFRMIRLSPNKFLFIFLHPPEIWLNGRQTTYRKKMEALDGRAKQAFAVFGKKGGQRNHELEILEVPESIVCNNPNTGRMLFEKPR